MKIILIKVFAVIAASTIMLTANAEETFSAVEKKALAGDYQAQRNLAYGYASYPYPEQPIDPVMACAWYIVILHSGSPKVDQGDIGNVSVYCSSKKLDSNGLELAKAKGRAIYKSIYKAQAQF